jgi:N-acetylneuraminic acid mutarotase
MLVFGGNPSLADGAAYSIASDTWRATAAASVGRESHTAVWTGSRMIVWGGYGGGALRNDGASYDPATNTWSAIAATTLPARMDQTAVWTGTEMIVWGGQTSSGNALGDGAAYNPTTNTWRSLATPTNFGRRFGHRAVWAGGKMVVFGGYDYFSGFSSPAPNTCAVKTATSFCGDAAAYDPSTDAWTVLTPPTPALDPRQRNAGVAIGARALFWGGEGNTSGGSLFRSSGAFYDVAAGTWTTMVAPTETLLPGAKRASMAAWSTADTFFVWGGRTGTATYAATGASYDVPTSTWKALPTLNAPSARAFATTIWTGTEALVWGGIGSSGTLKDGKIYRP